MIPWILSKQKSVKISIIFSKLSCLERDQYQIIKNDLLTIERGYLIYWLDQLQLNKNIIIPHNTYILCIYLFDLMANIDDINIDINFDAKCCALLSGSNSNKSYWFIM